MSKRGRKRSGAYVTSWGEVLVNWRKPDVGNFLIPIGKDKPRYSLSDERLAVMKAKRWEATHREGGPQGKHWTEVLAMSDEAYQQWVSEGRIRAESLPDSEALEEVLLEQPGIRTGTIFGTLSLSLIASAAR